MATLSGNIQGKLEANLAILMKEMEIEHARYTDQLKLKAAKFKANGMTDANIQDYLVGGQGLLLWDGHKNKIKAMVAGFISKTAELSYLKELLKANG